MITTIMNVRKMVQSYEQEQEQELSPPLGRTRLRSHTSQQASTAAAATQRSLRIRRSPSLKLVKEEGPVTAVLKDCTNGFQIEQTPNSTHLSVSLRTPDTTTRTLGHPSMTSAKLICSVLPPPPSEPLSSVPVRTAQQRRANLRARRQQRYSRDESALAAALRRPADYERVIPPRPPMQYATKQFEARINDAKARLADARDLLRDDTTDQVSHHALLRTRWMAERWIATAEKELVRVTMMSDHSQPSRITVLSARKSRRDANLAHFFSHSPTRTAVLSAQRPVRGPFQLPRRISKHNVEPPLLRTWPLTTTLRVPINLKGFRSSPSYDFNSQISGPSLQHGSSSSPKQSHPHELAMNSPLSQPYSLSCESNASTSSTTFLHTPVDDSGDRIWPGFALIHIPPQPSDEELLAALSADMKAEPIPEYATSLLDQLETIGEGVILPVTSLSRRGSTFSAFELVSRPSVEVYEYPIRPSSRLLVRRGIRVSSPSRPTMGILSGLRVGSEDHISPTSPRLSITHSHDSPRSSVLSRVRRSIAARGHQ